MSLTILDKTNFKQTISGAEKPVIIDFYADWCGPCKMLSPILEDIAAEGNVLVYKVNVDENQELAVEYAVMSIPNVVSFKGGQVYKRAVGVQPKNVLLSLVE